MPTTSIRLSAYPARTTTGHGYTSTEIAFSIGTAAPSRTIQSTSLQDITSAVGRFGQDVRAANPDASFVISVDVVRGQRKPRGFDAADKADTFGGRAFLRADVDNETHHRRLTSPSP